MPDDNTLGVETTLMRQVASYTGEQARELRADLEGLSRPVTDLLGGGWSGTAASAFAAAWGEFDASALDIAATLDASADELARSSATYGRGEAATLATVASAHSAANATFDGFGRFG